MKIAIDQTEKRRSFAAIEGFRGLAALTVATGHSVTFFGDYIPRHSYLAVDFFFILSGIVLAHSYDSRLVSRRMGGWGFFGIRALRLLPIVALSSIFAAIVHALILRAGSDATPFRDYGSLLVSALLTAALIPQIWMHEFYPLNGPLWSLFFELLVNVLFGATARFVRGAWLIALIMAAAIAMIVFTPASLSFDQGFHTAYWPLALSRTLFGFFIGVLIARLPVAQPRASNVLFLVGACLLGAIFWAPAWQGAPYDLIAALVLLPPCAWLATRIEPYGALERIARFFGKASYPLYAFNLPSVLLVAALAKLSGVGALVPGWAIGLAFLAGSLVAAYAVDRLYDEPTRAWLKRRLFPRRTPPSDSPAR